MILFGMLNVSGLVVPIQPVVSHQSFFFIIIFQIREKKHSQPVK